MKKCYSDSADASYVATAYGDEVHFAAVQVSEKPFTVQLLEGCPVRDSYEKAQADLDQYAAANSLKVDYSSSITFDSTVAADKCPICGHDDLEFYNGKFEGDYYCSKWQCHECGASGDQLEKTEYVGHEINVRDLGFLPEKPATTLKL